LECLVDARLQTSMSAFEVLTPPNPDYRELIQSMHAPILLVIGDKGGVSLDTARELRELNPLLRYELIPDAGHGVPYDQPERLGAAMSSFLRPISALRTGAAFVD
jgi:pimeloyl-ACP methyl ester carboxylesterase